MTAEGSGERGRILVGTLRTDEPQFESLRASLERQTRVRWAQFVIDGLPNREAHETLYRSFMERADDFDVLVKLDADMVLIADDALARILELHRASPELDHLVLAVGDWASGTLIKGLHTFSPRARWELPLREEMFVDPPPEVPGRSLYVTGPPAPLALHAPDPSPAQALRLGIHRGLKAVQPGREEPFEALLAGIHWRYLGRVWRRFVETGDARRGLVVAGADAVWRGQAGPEAYGGGDGAEEAFGRLLGQLGGGERTASPDALRALLSPRWATLPARLGGWIRAVGPPRWASGWIRDVTRRGLRKLAPTRPDRWPLR